MAVQFEVKPEAIFEFAENNPTVFFRCDRDNLEYFVDNDIWITMNITANTIEFNNGNKEYNTIFHTCADDYNAIVKNIRKIFAINDFSDPNNYYRLRDYVSNILTNLNSPKTINNERKEESTVNMSIPNFDFGKVTNGSVVMSFMGLAIKSKDGRYLHYNTSTEEITDVSGMEINNMSDFIYKMPVPIKDIAISDLIVHNGAPMYVKDVTGNSLIAIDVTTSEAKVIIPVKSIFGFNFVTKITSFVNFDMMGDADESNPFGSSMLPFLLMSKSGSSGSKTNDMLPLMMMMSGGKMDMSNPMMMMMLMGEGKMNDMLPLMMMMGNNPFAPKTKSE